MRLAQACCGCGGGSNNAVSDSASQAALFQIYDATQGSVWANDWNISSHFCTWSSIRCDDDAQLYSLRFSSGSTGTLPEALGSLTTLRIFASGFKDDALSYSAVSDLEACAARLTVLHR
jgi:hypothetical protein